MGTNPEPQPADTQQWYIEHLHGQSDESFLIISKLNGKALCPSHGQYVEATERNDDDDSQHWKRERSHIKSKKLNKVFFFTNAADKHYLVLIERKVNNKSEDVTFFITNVSI